MLGWFDFRLQYKLIICVFAAEVLWISAFNLKLKTKSPMLKLATKSRQHH